MKKENMFKQFFKTIGGFIKAIPEKVKNIPSFFKSIPTHIKSGWCWIKAFIVVTFPAFVSSIVGSTMKLAAPVPTTTPAK